MKASVKDVIQFADKIFSRVDKIPSHPLPINLGLLRLYALQTDLVPIPTGDQETPVDEKPEQDTPAHISEELVAEALHYYGYAIQAYNANPRIIQQDVMLNNLPDKETSNIKMPRHVVFLDHVTRSIVVSVRGTASVSDMLTDLYIEPYPFLEPSRNLFAHHGMAESAEALLPLVTAAIQEIRQRTYTASSKAKNNPLANILNRKSAKLYKYSDYRVVVTGHSLGAGTASLLAILLCMKSNITATAFAYAPPPVVSTLHAISHLKPHKWQIPFKIPFVKPQLTPSYQIHSFVHNNDIISRSSHTQILSLVSALSAVDQLSWGALDRAGMLLRNSLTTEEVRAIREALTHRKHFIEGNDKELYIPGDIYLLRPYTVAPDKNSTSDRGLRAKEQSGQEVNKSASGNASASADEASVEADVNSDAENTSNIPPAVAPPSSAPFPPSQVTIDFFGTSVTTQIPQMPELPQLPAMPQLPPQLVEALNLLSGASTDAENLNKFRAQNAVPSANHTDAASRTDKDNLSGSFYRCIRVTDPRELFNGLMYYGDGMVNDHLTAPFEKALLLLTSVNRD